MNRREVHYPGCVLGYPLPDVEHFFSGRIIASLPGSPPGTVEWIAEIVSLVGRWVPSSPMRRFYVVDADREIY